MYRPFLFGIVCIGLAAPGFCQNQPPREQSRDREINNTRPATLPDSIPAQTEIPVRVDQAINVQNRSDGRTYTGSVAQDVTGSDGTLLVPRGSKAELSVQNVTNQELSVDLEAVTINGRRYMVNAAAYSRSRGAGLGKNKRTGEYVGGGALFGTIIGAIAGGGKGAAIGAIAGGAAGAGTQVLTHGRTINIPAESVLKFKLNQPLELRSSR